MKDKKLKRLMDEYAAIPQGDREKDLSRLADQDVQLQPAPRGKARRGFWRYFAIGLSFVIVLAVSLPLALSLGAKSNEKGAQREEVLASSDASSGVYDSETGATPGDSEAFPPFYALDASVAGEVSKPFSIREIPSIGQFNLDRSAHVLEPKEEGRTYEYVSEGEAFVVAWRATDDPDSASMSVQLSFDTAPVLESTAVWRGATVYYQAGETYRITFVYQGDSYDVRGRWNADVVEILDSLFGE